MFLHVSVILSTWGVSGQGDPPRETPQTRQTHPPSPRPGRHPPDQADTPWTRQTPPGPGRHTPRTRQTPPDQADTPPDQADTPPDQADTPPTRQTPPRPGRHPPVSRLQNTVYERPVRILLECILVKLIKLQHLSVTRSLGQNALNNFHNSCNSRDRK